MDFHGSLEEFHLPDVIQFLSGAGKTGVLKLASDPQEGCIYLLNGRIVHAVSSDLVGEEAVYALFLLPKGTFDFVPDVTADTSTVRRSNTSLLIEAARWRDEWPVISERVPGFDWVPEFVLPEKAESGMQITLNTSEWVVLSKVDGRRSVRAIAGAANLSVFHISRLLYGLASTGLIRLRRPLELDQSAIGFPE